MVKPISNNSSLADRLKDKIEKSNTPTFPSGKGLWVGPNGEGEQGGITFSLLSRFLCCRERFRLLVCEGLKSQDTFNHRLEFGNLFHLAEETYTRVTHDPTMKRDTWREAVSYELHKYEAKLKVKYPFQRELVEHWSTVCALTFPEYVKYWDSIGSDVKRVSIAQEKVFDVLYKLPSGRQVRLRGKWDGLDILNPTGDSGLYVFDHKTKGDPNKEKITKELTYDLQMMMYVIAVQEYQDHSFWNRSNKNWRDIPVKGVRYNVIRRPLSGGKGTIVRHKARGTKQEESKESYYQRVLNYILEDPGSYFMRWKVELSEQDIVAFKRDCFDPILENLCNWWDLVEDNTIDKLEYLTYGLHYRLPFNIYNPLMEGGNSELDEYLMTGSTLGLTRCTDLFPELREVA